MPCPSDHFPTHRWAAGMLAKSNDQFTDLGRSGNKRSPPTSIAEFVIPTPVFMPIVEHRRGQGRGVRRATKDMHQHALEIRSTMVSYHIQFIAIRRVVLKLCG